nr:hypothetical protein [Tanacetum cinerariifolium]
PRTSVKGQILADFIIERPKDDPLNIPIEDKEELPDPWVLFKDGSSCIDGSRAGLIITNPVNGVYVAKEPGMIKYLEKVKNLASTFEEFFIKQIHEGSCNMHAGPRSVVAKALRSGYYWPTMHTDARNLIRECSSCQWFDIAGPFPEGPGEIISDNGKQFRDNPFKDWCEKLCIRQCFASVKHPQANGLVERENRSLGEGIKDRNGETPFLLTYGAEAVIPVEIGMPTLRTAKVDMIKNDEALGVNLDLLEEKREQAVIQKAKKQSQDEEIL